MGDNVSSGPTQAGQECSALFCALGIAGNRSPGQGRERLCELFYPLGPDAGEYRREQSAQDPPWEA